MLYLTRGIVNSGFEYYSSRVKKDGLYEKQETMLPAGPGDKAAVQPGSLQTVDPAASVEAQRIFTKIFERNSWGSMASVSGPSSTLLRTENLRSELPRIFTKYKVQKVFDAPCGDLNWMKEVLRVSDVSYLGADIVKPLIDKHIWDNAEVAHHRVYSYGSGAQPGIRKPIFSLAAISCFISPIRIRSWF